MKTYICRISAVFLAVTVGVGTQSCNSSSAAESDGAVEAVPVEILKEDDQPSSGTEGSKQITFIRSEGKFMEKWFLYTNDPLPTVDFSEQAVVLYDLGERDANPCSKPTHISSVAGSLINKSTTRIETDLFTTCVDSGISCLQEIVPHRPYMFLIFDRMDQGEITVSESLEFQVCI